MWSPRFEGTNQNIFQSKAQRVLTKTYTKYVYSVFCCFEPWELLARTGLQVRIKAIAPRKSDRETHSKLTKVKKMMPVSNEVARALCLV